MKEDAQATLRSFLIELAIYSFFVAAYYFFVLHFLGDWLKHLFDARRLTFAVVSLLLVIGQGVALEMATTALLGLIKRRGV